MIDSDGLPAQQRNRVMFCILLGGVLSNIDAAIANIALPTIAHELAASDAATVWVVNGYQLALAVCLLPAAALGEILGPKPIYAFGLVIFALASLGCAVSPTLGFLVAARLVQGIGGACVAALGPALIREIYPRRMLGQGLALIAMSVALSGVVGPTIAALILSVAKWPWLFLVNLPFCIVAVPMFLAFAPPSARQTRPFDILGALLNAAALGLVVTGVDALGSHVDIACAEIAAGFVALALLIMQQRSKALLLPLDLMRIPLFALSFATSTFSYAAQMMAFISLPFLFQTVLHRSQAVTGLLVTPWPLLVACAAFVAGRLSSRYPASILGGVGLSVLTIGLLLLVALPAEPGDWNIAWRMALCGAGFGFFQTPNNIALLTAAPVARTGAAGGMLAVARTIGWSLGSALVALIFQVSGADSTTACLEAAAGLAAIGAMISSARLFQVAPR